jgi:hypothetical protein
VELHICFIAYTGTIYGYLYLARDTQSALLTVENKMFAVSAGSASTRIKVS